VSTNSINEEIRREIDASPRIGWTRNGRSGPCITFRDYMFLCLYHPEFGYYRSGTSRVGREGDFYTSAYVGDIMGGQLAERLAGLASERFPERQQVEVIDWGGGTGRLGSQMMAAWKTMGESGKRFFLTVLDGNPSHRQQAEEALAGEVAEGSARVISPSEAKAEEWKSRSVIVVANELLDAFPVHRVVMDRGRLLEWGVSWDEASGCPLSCLTELSDPELGEWLERQSIRLAEGQTTEIGLEGAGWTAWLASQLGEAILVLIDYGDLTGELTGSHRMEGTLLCYDHHRAHTDPFRSPGEQDLTAHVDFNLVRDRASQSGWRELWYGTQKRFLVESGILAKLADHGISDPFHPVVRRNRAIRQLLLSDGMSELFKVQIWVKPR
jgi:SAM-dependent MidA family methyltransferase